MVIYYYFWCERLLFLNIWCILKHYFPLCSHRVDGRTTRITLLTLWAQTQLFFGEERGVFWKLDSNKLLVERQVNNDKTLMGPSIQRLPPIRINSIVLVMCILSRKEDSEREGRAWVSIESTPQGASLDGVYINWKMDWFGHPPWKLVWTACSLIVFLGSRTKAAMRVLFEKGNNEVEKWSRNENQDRREKIQDVIFIDGLPRQEGMDGLELNSDPCWSIVLFTMFKYS